MSNSSPDSNQELRNLPRLPDIQLVRMVGKGSYGQVWLAINEITQKLLAVKIIPLVSPDDKDRVGREITSLIYLEATARHKHENLMTIDHVGQTCDFLYYLMEPADDMSGGPASLSTDYRPATLAARLRSGSLPLTDCLKWTRQLLAGLGCLHEASLAHRDIKPENCIFVGGTLKLTDYGLLTHSNGTASLVGTPVYMPPDGQMNACADVYAAGLVIYEMITGLPPDSFPRCPPQIVQNLQHPVLCALNRIVLKACQPDPGQRFKDAAAILHTLEMIISTAPRQGARRRRYLLAACICAIGGLAVFLGSRYGLAHPQQVNVNFITIPYEAEIYLDGVRAIDVHGKPYRTPCTVIALPAHAHHVIFKTQGLPDLDMGKIDFGKSREVSTKWQPIE